MWKKVIIDGQDFVVKHIVSEKLHNIQITDFKNLWFENVQEDVLLLRCKEMNKLVEASEDIFLRHIFSLLESERDDVSRSFSNSDHGKILNLQTSLEGLKFKIKFLLTPANHSQFYEEVTSSLLTIVSELEKRQQLLVNLIKSKDVEILEYKLEGGQISRKAIETDQFDLEAFSVKCAGDISVTKSTVAAQPSHVLTPLVQDLLDKITVAPVIPFEKTMKGANPTKIKKTEIKLKSPKNKKSRMYEDDDGDNNEDECGNEDGDKITENKDVKNTNIKSGSQLKPAITQRKTKYRTQNTLPNL